MENDLQDGFSIDREDADGFDEAAVRAVHHLPYIPAGHRLTVSDVTSVSHQGSAQDTTRSHALLIITRSQTYLISIMGCTHTNPGQWGSSAGCAQ